MEEWQPVEVYSTQLRIRGQIQILPGRRLSDEVNRLTNYLELRNTVTEPLLSTPLVSTTESNTTIAKSAILMVVPGAEAEAPAAANRALWREKVRHQVVLNTSAVAMTADILLDPRQTLISLLEQAGTDFIPITRMSAVVVATLGGTPQMIQREFALLNPTSVVSFSVRSVG